MAEASRSSKRKASSVILPFKPSWEEAYLFTKYEGKLKCLSCSKTFTCARSFNLKRHYDANHAQDYENLTREERLQTIQVLKDKLSQAEDDDLSEDENACFNNESAVRCSYKIALEIAKSSRPFTDGEFIKNWLLITAELCLDEINKFESISLSRMTIMRRIQEMANDITRQLTDLGQEFTGFSLAMDEAIDISGTSHLAIFIRGVNENLEIIEGLLDFCSLKETTTGDDITAYVEEAVDNISLDWAKLVSITTSGSPAMMEKYVGFVDSLRKKLKSLAVPRDISVVHSMLHQQNLCAKSIELQHVMSVVIRVTNYIRTNGANHREFKTFLSDVQAEYGDLPLRSELQWFSRGKILDRFFHLRDEIILFMGMVDQLVPELQDNEWLCDLGFLSDMTDHLDALNTQLRGKEKSIVDFHNSVCAFKEKIQLWTRQIERKNVCHFPKLKSVITQDTNLNRYESILRNLDDEFSSRFQDLQSLENDFNIVATPFSVNVDEAAPQFQLELIDLRYDLLMKDKFQRKSSVSNFYKNFPQNRYPRLHECASRIIVMVGSTYLCEKLFSVMKKAKSSFRTAMTDYNLKCSLILSTHQSLVPNITRLLEKKRLQVRRTSVAKQ
ncbi:general transcription factor II-I repeat domain-containing protein 2-like [Andrena cerasifolii]|uniref:general transcription factor II-I repeat domain-containing protein 2-like n=1 Tax=Andrena cerasifolii TaxID=2819439 RepID=UPI00403769B5